MKYLYVLLTIFLLSSCQTNLSGGDLYYWTLDSKDTPKVAEKKLEKVGKNIKLSSNSKNGTLELSPKDQVISERKNLDFSLGYYNEQFVGFTKFNVEQKDEKEVIKIFNLIEDPNNKGKFNGEMGSLKITFETQDRIIEIWNEKLRNEIFDKPLF